MVDFSMFPQYQYDPVALDESVNETAALGEVFINPLVRWMSSKQNSVFSLDPSQISSIWGILDYLAIQRARFVFSASRESFPRLEVRLNLKDFGNATVFYRASENSPIERIIIGLRCLEYSAFGNTLLAWVDSNTLKPGFKTNQEAKKD